MTATQSPTSRHQVAPKTQAPAPLKYTMPRPKLGAWVYWYPEWREASIKHIALVTELGEDSLALTVFVAGASNHLPKTAVRHIADPRKAMIENVGAGVWGECEDDTDPVTANGDSYLADFYKTTRDSAGRIEVLERTVRQMAETAAEQKELVDKLTFSLASREAKNLKAPKESADPK